MCFLSAARTSYRRSMKPFVTSTSEECVGNTGLSFDSFKKASYLISEFCSVLYCRVPSWFELLAIGFSVGFSWSKLRSESSLATYFFLEEVSTRDWTFCISASSSCLHALLSWRWVLSMLFFTIENFCTVHLLTSISVLIFVRAAESSLSTVWVSFVLN